MPVYGDMGHLQNELHSLAGGAHGFSLTIETDIHRRLYHSGKHLNTVLPTTRDTRKDGLELLTFGPGSKAHMARAITASGFVTIPLPYLTLEVRSGTLGIIPASQHHHVACSMEAHSTKSSRTTHVISSSPRKSPSGRSRNPGLDRSRPETACQPHASTTPEQELLVC